MYASYRQCKVAYLQLYFRILLDPDEPRRREPWARAREDAERAADELSRFRHKRRRIQPDCSPPSLKKQNKKYIFEFCNSKYAVVF